MAGSERWVVALFVVIGFILLVFRMGWRCLPSATHQVHPKPSPRPLKPRTPDDCSACRVTPQPGVPPATPPLKPFSQVMGHRPILRRAQVPSRVVEGRCAYYFVRPHTSLSEPLAEPCHRGRKRLPQRFPLRTPAQAVGVTDHRWTIVELLSYPLPRAVG
jgi:hypothetical protein